MNCQIEILPGPWKLIAFIFSETQKNNYDSKQQQAYKWYKKSGSEGLETDRSIYKQINMCASCKKNKECHHFASAAYWIYSVFLFHVVLPFVLHCNIKKRPLWLCVHNLVTLPFLHCLVFPTFSGAKKNDPPPSTFLQLFFKYSVPGTLLPTSPSQDTGLSLW